jgi:hypothetical protein
VGGAPRAKGAGRCAVPAGAEWAAFVLAREQVQLRQVKTGRSSGTETQILSGLNAGDTAILYPGDRLHDGQRVQPMDIATQALDGPVGAK